MLISKYLTKYYLKYFWYYAIGIITLVLVDFAQLLIPEFLGQIVKNFQDASLSGGVFTAEMIADVSRIVLYTIFIGFGLFIGRFLWRITIFRASSKIEANLRHDMFQKAEKLSVSYYHHTKVGTIMAWFTNDLETLEEYLGFGVVMMVDAFVMGTLCLVKMFILSWQFTLVAIIPMLLIVLWGALVEKFMQASWDLRQKAYDSLYDFAQESFTGIRVIKAFVKQRHELHAFAKVAKKNKEVNIKFVRLSVFLDVVIEILIGIIFSLIIGLGGYAAAKTVQGSDLIDLFGSPFVIEPYQVIEFIGYFDALIWPLIALGQIVTMHSRSKASLNRVEDYLNTPETVKNDVDAIPLNDVRGEIEFKDFTFKYPSASETHLKKISLKIKEGESVGIVGKIGCGKTTLVNSLLRLYNVSEGSIFIDGKDIMKCTFESIRDNIGYVPQDNFLFSDTVKRNIAFSNVNISQEEVEKAATFACVDGDIQEFKDKYETVTGERGVTLSGGQKQRISIARAFIKNAPILIFDDSVSAVDVKTEETILRNIKEQRKGKTTLVVASRVSTVNHLDKIIVLNNGMVEAFDTPKNLLETSPTYKKMVYLQELEREVEGR